MKNMMKNIRQCSWNILSMFVWIGVFLAIFMGIWWQRCLSSSQTAVAEDLIGLGAVSHASIRFWVLQALTACTKNQTKIIISVVKWPGINESLSEWEQQREVNTYSWVHLQRSCTTAVSIDGLQANTRYNYRATWEREGRFVTQHDGSFTTFPDPVSPSPFNFSFGSCLQVRPIRSIAD